MADRMPLKIKVGRPIKGAQLNYAISGYKGKGGSGVVYRGTCRETKADVAIKFFLPLYELNLELFDRPGSQIRILEETEELYTKEIQALHEINHPYIVRIIDKGEYQPLKGELEKPLRSIGTIRFFVMEFVDGMNLEECLTNQTLSRSAFFDVLSKVCEALVYLHEKKEYLHADIRASNILVREGTSDPVLIDFALYKNFCFTEVEPEQVTKLLGDWDLLPKDIPTNHPLKKFKETSGTRQRLKEICFPGLDLFQLGKLLLGLQNQTSKLLSREDAEFLGTITDELLAWNTVASLNAKWLLDQIRKLAPGYTQFMGVEELTPPSSAIKTVQLPGRILTTSPIIERLANTRSFRRLRSINQLTLIDILYPGAGYKRHLHCFRAYGYCGDLLESLIHSAQFRMLFSPRLARQTLAVSLLHDINHFPFLHTFQEMQDQDITNIDLLDFFCDGKATQDSPSIYELLVELGLERQQFKDLLLLDHQKFVDKDYEEGLQITKSIIDSGADVDKLAYLEDDSSFTGVAYGRGVDSPRLLASSTVVNVPDGNGWHIGFHERGLSAVESLVMARYWMFRNVYWHRVNRGIMTMLIHVIRKLYGGSWANAKDFISDTMWQSEEAVLEYLNAKHVHRYGIDSITRFILRDQTLVYQRLVSIQGASTNDRESKLYAEITGLDFDRLEKFRQNATEAFANLLEVYKFGETLGPDDVLFDIPGRRLDMSGPIYIRLESGEAKKMHDLAGPVERLSKEFDALVKRLRVFVNPRIMNRIDPEVSLTKRQDMIKLLEQAIPERGAAAQIK
jgi:uncharacterized protein